MRITVDLIRKKSEHNDGILETLQELSLHQLNLEKIEVIGSCCKHLRILYLQNNLIPKIENLKRLKELQYLNLALNNIKKIEGLQSCESLTKLDLTVNFIGKETFEASILNLRKNQQLKNLFLTGNPCCELKGYRRYVVATLPWLERLDGNKITKSERILARQDLKQITQALRLESGVVPKPSEIEDDEDEGGEAFTPENRLKWHKEELEEERKKQEAHEKAIAANKPPDPLKEARKKMSEKVVDVPPGTLPPQRNMPRVKFSFKDDAEGNVVATIHAPKYLDTSQIEVDIHPKWFQCIIKDKNLLLHTPEDVHPDKSRIKRLLHNGHLLLIMPKVNFKGKKFKSAKGSEKAENKTAPRNAVKAEREKNLDERRGLAVDYRNIVAESKSKKKSAASVHLGFLSHKTNYALEETTKVEDEGNDGDESSDIEDDADVPPLS